MKEARLTSPISIMIDNKAAIQSGASPSTSAGGYLIDQFIRMTNAISDKCKENDLNIWIMVRWIPGHAGIPGNEKADEEAKRAAEGEDQSSPKRQLPRYLGKGPLPHSISALKQWHQEALKRRWRSQWEKSPRFARAKVIDASMPSPNFMKLANSLPKYQTSIYTQLRTRHAPLNQHLHHIGKTASPHCIACPGREETIYHLLFDCPQYTCECHTLRNTLRCNASSIGFILTSEKATNVLMKYINSTSRFKSTFGENSLD